MADLSVAFDLFVVVFLLVIVVCLFWVSGELSDVRQKIEDLPKPDYSANLTAIQREIRDSREEKF